MSDLRGKPEIETALASFMAEEQIDRDEALRRILRDWLIGHGYLKPEPHAAFVGGDEKHNG